MYLEDQNIRNIQQLASRIHVYVVVFVLQFLELPELSFHRRVFFSGEQMKLKHVCPTLIVKLSCSAQPFWLVLCSILLMKLNSNGRIRQEFGMSNFFHRSKIKTAAAGLMNFPMFTSWVDLEPSKFLTLDPRYFISRQFGSMLGIQVVLFVLTVSI